MNRIALIGDIIASRSIKDRAQVQEKLNKFFLNINNSNRELLSPFTITLGDEFQALYSQADSIFKDIWKILEILFPVTVRFSIGIGNLTTKINKKQAIGMDGPAFHFARKGLDELKNSSFIFNIKTENEKEVFLAKNALPLISHNTMKLKHTRIKIFNLLNEGKSVKEISNKLHITVKVYTSI
jgi:hypothetical protein